MFWTCRSLMAGNRLQHRHRKPGWDVNILISQGLSLRFQQHFYESERVHKHIHPPTVKVTLPPMKNGTGCDKTIEQLFWFFFLLPENYTLKYLTASVKCQAMTLSQKYKKEIQVNKIEWVAASGFTSGLSSFLLKSEGQDKKISKVYFSLSAISRCNLHVRCGYVAGKRVMNTQCLLFRILCGSEQITKSAERNLTWLMDSHTTLCNSLCSRQCI